MDNSVAEPVSLEDRFQFGKNWKSFLDVVTEERIKLAESSLKKLLGVESLDKKSFFDVGSGSGLFSLAANRLGAAVTSIDFDPNSVDCTKLLKKTKAAPKSNWKVKQGSVLNEKFINSFGEFDFVYSWGVLHHTGDMNKALSNVIPCVKPGGTLAIAIYNDQGFLSKFWLNVKKLYCSSLAGRAAVIVFFFPIFAGHNLVQDILNLKNPFTRYRESISSRGMSIIHDWLDWLGGYPFEVASTELITNFYTQRGFKLETSNSTSGMGNNEFVFKKLI